MFLFPQTFFSYLSSFLLLISLPFSLSFYLTDSNPLLSFNSLARVGHLYTDNHRRAMYLQITLDGRVSGSDVQTPYSVLELKAVRPGHIVIKGKSSSLYLCVDNRGFLRGQKGYTEADCTFSEQLLADGYTRFISSHHRFPVSLASKQSQERHAAPFTRFLPLKSTVSHENMSEQPESIQKYFNLDSDDPLGIREDAMISPLFSMDK